jgi:hypothetical protein
MDSKELSKQYFNCTHRIHNAATALYEALHSEDGEPKRNTDALHNTIRKYKRETDGEFDQIRSLINEFKDNHTDIS